MAQKTKAEILSEITTLLADNNVGDISAEDVRSVFTDIKDSYPNLSDASVSETEFGYLDGVTSPIQTQINSKSNLDSPTFTGTVTLPATSADGRLTATNGITLENNVILRGKDSLGADQIVAVVTNSDDLLLSDSDLMTVIRGSSIRIDSNLDINGNNITNIDQLTLSHSGSGTGASFTHNGTGNAVSITKSNSGDALDVVSGTVRIQALTADRWLFVDSNNRVTVKTNAELLTAIGAITEVSEDTTPQLGGNLDAQANNINNVTAINAESGTFTAVVTADSLEATNGATGTFTTVDGKEVTVTSGIITNIV